MKFKKGDRVKLVKALSPNFFDSNSAIGRVEGYDGRSVIVWCFNTVLKKPLYWYVAEDCLVML